MLDLVTGLTVVASIAAVVASFYLCYIVRPWWRLRRDRDTQDWWLHGLFIGFAATGINAAFWSVKWIALLFDFPCEVINFVHVNGAYIDWVFKGVAAYAAVIHIHALRRMAALKHPDPARRS